MKLFHHTSSDSPKQVVLLTHGLNLHPKKMTPLAEALSDKETAVIRLGLTGVENLNEFKGATAERWRSDFDQAVLEAQKLAPRVALIGFSLGGLLSLDYYFRTRNPAIHYFGLICPSVVTNRWTHAVRWLSNFERLLVPSASDRDYQNHRFTPVSAYNSLFQIYDEFLSEIQKESELTLPKTRLVLAKSDELVNSKAVSQFMKREMNFEEFDERWLPKKRQGRSTRLNHLAIDPTSLGDLWENFVGEIREDLLALPEKHNL